MTSMSSGFLSINLSVGNCKKIDAIRAFSMYLSQETEIFNCNLLANYWRANNIK